MTGLNFACDTEEIMEDMEIDQIVDIPDTPDRLTARHVGRKYAGNPDVYMNEKGERVLPVAENSKNGRLAFCLPKSSNSGEVNNGTAASSSNDSYSFHNAPIFRRSRSDKSFSEEFAYTAGSEKMDKGKNMCLKFPANSSSSGNGGVTVFDLTEENGQPQKQKPFFSHHGLKDNATETKKDGKTSVRNSPISCIPDSSNLSCNALRGKCKMDDKAHLCSNITVDRGKSIDLSSDSQQKSEKQVSLSPHLITAPRFRGQKRLVRNGCISPYNIAARAKQSAEQNDVEQSHVVDDVSSNTVSHMSINDIVTEERSSNRVKGKELSIHPSSVHDARTIKPSSPMDNHEETNGTSNAIRNSDESCGGSDGLIITHNRRATHWPLHDVTGHRSRRGEDSERFISTQYRSRVGRRDTGSSQNTMDLRHPLENHATSLIEDAEQSTRPCTTADKLTKRQRKNASTSTNLEPEIMILDSPGESSNLRSPRGSEVVELLPGTASNNRASHDFDDTSHSDSDTRARQVEADEILARELQEQLYHEDSFDGGEHIDEHLAWALQHEEEVLHTSIESHHISQPGWLSRAAANRQPRSRPHQSPTNRRRVVPHAPPSNRVSQLRSRFLNRSSVPAIQTRGRRLRFPVDMDFDMRLDILEALEDAVGDISDMGIAEDMFQAHSDFNENDYEMLLTLDENNHQHAGATVHQINNLPQSTIQTDNFQEACAICLEIPVMGETIRHLPCLHKFHKDCIDPWLRRRTSCPVCKSSIT